jgi:hypothetical protein
VNHIEAVIQVTAEPGGRDEIGQRAIGCRNEPNIDHACETVRSDRVDLSALREAKKYRLHPWRHLTDFVQKQRAAVGEGGQSGLVPVGTGEAAPHVAEEFRLEQGVGQSCAIDGHKALRSAPSLGVDEPCGDVLADTGFALDENRGVSPGG